MALFFLFFFFFNGSGTHEVLHSLFVGNGKMGIEADLESDGFSGGGGYTWRAGFVPHSRSYLLIVLECVRCFPRNTRHPPDRPPVGGK